MKTHCPKCSHEFFSECADPAKPRKPWWKLDLPDGKLMCPNCQSILIFQESVIAKRISLVFSIAAIGGLLVAFFFLFVFHKQRSGSGILFLAILINLLNTIIRSRLQSKGTYIPA